MNKTTFAGIPQEYATLETSKIVIIPIPYDDTVTWKKGAQYGPNAFLKASQYLELYDIETNSEVYKRGIFLASPINKFNNSPTKMIHNIYSITKKYLLKNKFVTIIGGEHSISIGSIRAFGELFENLSILHMDAHADLRPIYNNNPYNHACSMYEASKKYTLVQIGIRSMDIQETKYVQKGNIFYNHDIYNNKTWMEQAINKLSNNIFISIDIDVFDPGIAPSTGTPEPGGMLWYNTLLFLKQVFTTKQVVGFDIVELSPNNNEYSTDFLVAKLFYKLLSYKYELKLDI
ncbi:agmatinase [Blattabacterium cuenoti]|uniref:agmatinase n=1 Tax=Blattabacterium cuenoti TaxID=1653831 RepID=UPI00163CDF34|nr:agmatinase [Blattabacterium cuenoti]